MSETHDGLVPIHDIVAIDPDDLLTHYSDVRERLMGALEPRVVTISEPQPVRLSWQPHWLVILQEEALQAGLTIAQLKGEQQGKAVVQARDGAAYRLFVELGYSAARIGRILNKDHTTILTAIKRFAARWVVR